MAKRPSLSSDKLITSKVKKTRQGASHMTKLSASSRNGSKKRYKGRGR